jgi:hypothetical protein
MSILTSADCMPTISITEIDKDELKGKWVDIEESMSEIKNRHM